jgi:beta-glucosidase
VKNTGSRAGAEVVQLYVSDDKCSVEREPKALKAFKKVFLKPGQTKRIEFKLSWRDFAFWSPSEKKWTVEPGAFTLSAGSSSRDIAGSERFELN